VEGLSPEALTGLQAGLDSLYLSLLGRVEAGLAGWERAAAATSLHVPPELFLAPAPAAPAGPPAGPADEAALDAELAALRAELLAARGAAHTLRAEALAAERDLAAAAAAGDAGALEPLVAAVSTNRGALLEDVAAIAEAARRLQPLLAKAQALQAERHGAGAGAGGGGSDGVPAARRAQQRMADSGATLQQIKGLASALGGDA